MYPGLPRRKSNNEHFFQEFLHRYITQAQKTIPAYQTTDDDMVRKQQLDRISVFSSSIPFNITLSGSVFMADNRRTLVQIELIDFSSYITSERIVARGNNWRSDHDETSMREILGASLFGKSKSMELKEIRLETPLDINVAEIARHFPENFHRKPYEKFSGGMDDSELIREEGG